MTAVSGTIDITLTCMTALPPSVTVIKLCPTGSFCTASARLTFAEPSFTLK